MTEITNEELKRIFSAHIDCNVSTCEGVFKLHGISGSMLCAEVSHEQYGYYEYSRSQLILKPLSAISDEDILAVANILYDGVSDRIANKIGYMYQLAASKEFAQKLMETSLTGLKQTQLIDLLRAKGYNMGYGKYTPQDLIDAGIVAMGLRIGR